MIKIKGKIMLLALLSILNTSCKDNEKIIENETIINTIKHEDNRAINNITPKILSEEKDSQEELITPYKCVMATTNVNIRQKPIDGDVLGVLKSGDSLRFIKCLENGWYEVEYYGNTGYISGDYAELTTGYEINTNIKKVYYALDDIELSILNLHNSEPNTIVNIPSLECFEVYEEYDEHLLVKTNDYIGYIKKENIEELKGTFVVIDISDQELKLYYDNSLVLSCPVVTGKPGTPSDQGVFSIYDITHNRYLVGLGYKEYVDIMMAYNGGEGLHDASYHTHDDGFSHGWRSDQEFGGETYLNNGSHGCINMKREDVMEVAEYVDNGTIVLVKQ